MSNYFSKQADLGSDGQNASFERTFANIAHAYLRDKAPSLMPYEVAFQLLDRSEDKRKAAGLLAFNVNSLWVYVPLFFVAGKVTGHEMMYIKDQDQIVPLKEKWVQYLLSLNPEDIGEPYAGKAPGHRSLSFLKDRLTKSSAYSQFSRWTPEAQDAFVCFAKIATSAPAPGKPFAEYVVEEAAIAVPYLNYLRNSYPHVYKQANTALGGKLETAYWQALENPTATKVKRLNKLAKQANLLETVYDNPVDAGKIRIATVKNANAFEVFNPLSDKDKETLMSTGRVVQDSRDDDEVSQAFVIRKNMSFCNPVQSGVYDVWNDEDKFERALVILNPKFSSGKANEGCIVIALERSADSEPNCWIGDKSKVWINTENKDQDFFKADLLEGVTSSELPTKSVIKWEERKKYVWVGQSTINVEGTAPLRIESVINSEDGGKTYEGSFTDYDLKREYRPGRIQYKTVEAKEQVVIKPKGKQITVSAEGVFVPESYKAIRINDRDFYDCGPCDTSEGADKEPTKRPFKPGSYEAAYRISFNKTAEIVVSVVGDEAIIDGKPIKTAAARDYLTVDLGFRDHISEFMLKRAEETRKATFCVEYAGWVKPRLAKQARATFLEQGPVASQSVPDNDLFGSLDPMSGSTKQEMFLSEDRPHEYQEPDDQSVDSVMQAIGTGSQEAIDSAAFSSMLSTVRDESMIDTYFPELMKALDRVGRILFQFRWHREKFEDRFGKKDLPELEDALQNTFESMGDLIIFLKQKQVQSVFDFSGGGTENGISEVAE
jgi:hypothetical protein